MRTPEEIVHGWIKAHAPLAVKMTLTPEVALHLIEAINKAQVEARAAALEEAAKVMEAFWANLEDERSAQEQAAAAIRALQEP